MPVNSDDTVIVQPARAPAPAPRRVTLARLVAAASLALALTSGGAAWLLRPAADPSAPPAVPRAAPPLPAPPPPALEAIPAATEAAIDGESAAVRTVLRFAPNPAIVVVDFATLREQGRMLNRVAAWAEKAGVPHDRLLSDAELAAVIQTSGATADTYYYGHDYSGAEIAQFFALADRDGTALGSEEQELRRLMARAGAELDGFGALISIVRAASAADLTPRARGTILHHELSHGEYFTNPAYAAFVSTVWRGVLTPEERASFRTYLASEGYDPALEDLMRNEMQAYLMHTPDAEFFDPDKLGIAAPRLAQIRAAFLAGMPPGWLRDETAAMLPELPTPKARPALLTPPH